MREGIAGPPKEQIQSSTYLETMCGICGYINLNGAPASREIVDAMNQTLIHRGPDGGGEFVKANTSLGHRRLAIVDVARGHQPMTLRDSPFTIVYNGEIYNHMELRTQLGLSAHRFETHCDTETILAAFQKFGPHAVPHFQGMFALAIHNSARRSLFLSRDRLGIKPLYYFQNDRLFAFASEIKALLAHPEIKASVNVAKLPQQLTLKYTLDDETLYAGIRKLMPGHSLTVHQGRITTDRYWDVSFVPKRSFRSLDAAATEFKQRFDDSVRARLMADVPLGVFLSGGIDSAVIAASMSRMRREPIRAFSIAFAQKEFNELRYSRMAARHVNADLRELVLKPKDWFAAWPHMVYHEDEPIAHPSSISLHFLAKMAAQDVKVVLTGEGSDELLAGYERYYQTLTNLRYGRLVPNGLRTLTRQMIRCLPDRFLPKRKAVRTSLYLPSNINALYLDNYAAFSRNDVRQALQPDVLSADFERTYDSFASLMDEADATDLLDRILYADMRTYLVELLMKQDQMSMSASLESRVPFLDHNLVEFACSLPTEFKLKGFDTKRILRRALGSTVPKEIVSRSKKGFPTPTRDWFRREYAETVRRLLQSSHSRIHEYIRPDYVETVLSRHQSGRWNLEEQIWTLTNLELWLRIAIDGQSPAEVMPFEEEALTCSSSG